MGKYVVSTRVWLGDTGCVGSGAHEGILGMAMGMREVYWAGAGAGAGLGRGAAAEAAAP